MLLATTHGYFNTDRDLVILNCVLAVATAVTAFVAFRTIRSSDTVARAAQDQAQATNQTVEKANQQLELGRKQLEKEEATLQASVRPIIVDVPVAANSIDDEADPSRRWWIGGEMGTHGIEILIRNIGTGPAFVRDAQLMTGSGYPLPTVLDRKVIAPGETAQFRHRTPVINTTNAPRLKTALIASTVQIAYGVRTSNRRIGESANRMS